MRGEQYRVAKTDVSIANNLQFEKLDFESAMQIIEEETTLQPQTIEIEEPNVVQNIEDENYLCIKLFPFPMRARNQCLSRSVYWRNRCHKICSVENLGFDVGSAYYGLGR